MADIQCDECQQIFDEDELTSAEGRLLCNSCLANLDTPFDMDEEDDDYCPRCGSYLEWQDCWECGGAGWVDDTDYPDDDCQRRCGCCRGLGGWWECPNLPHAPVEKGKAR